VRYLCTGGAGFIGTALAVRLIRDGHEVAVLDDMSAGKPGRLAGTGIQVTVADVRDEAAVTAAARGADSVIHLAYIQGTANFYTRPSEILSVALDGMRAVLAACKAHGIRELVYVSSAEAHQSPVLPTPEDTPLTVPDVLNPRFSYGGGKIACELMAAAAHHDGLLDRAVIIRPHNVIGPDMSDGHIVPDLARQMNRLVREYPAPAGFPLNLPPVIPFPVQGTGEETRCYTWIGDAIDQFTLIMEHAGPLGACHLGSQDERTTAEVAHQVAACYGRRIRVIPSALAAGSPPRRRPGLGFLDSLGYQPQVPFAEAIARTVAWYQEES
jgi:dTDP-glucose 4,6-dehydratase/UDP-glucose 4-epimerase